MYFQVFEDHINLENGKFELLNPILSLKTMMNRIFFF